MRRLERESEDLELVSLMAASDEENQTTDETPIVVNSVSGTGLEQDDTTLNHPSYAEIGAILFYFIFCGSFIWLAIREKNRLEKKEKEHNQKIYCYDLELNNLTKERLDFLRPRDGSDCSIHPWRNIAHNETMSLTKNSYGDYYSKCTFFTSTGIQLSVDDDGYQDDEYKHDTVTSKGKDENNCWITVKKLSDCSYALLKNCPTPTHDIASEYHLLPKP